MNFYRLKNFFTVVKALVSQVEADPTQSDGQHHYSTLERELTEMYVPSHSHPLLAHYFMLYTSFYATQSSFRASLSDSFNTPEALTCLRDLVSRTNIYINTQGKNLNVGLIEHIARWVGSMLRMFGLGEGERAEIGWGQDEREGGDINVSFPHYSTILCLT